MAKKRSKLFEDLMAGAQEAIAWHKDKKFLTVRDVELRPPAPMGARQVTAIRAKLRVSQAAFARILNVSPKTVQAWEANTRRPSDAALKLLSIAKAHPEALLE
jgi:putative transcriptional regulator